MNQFRIVHDLSASLFNECAVWSEYYDFEELEEIRSWGVSEKYIDELLRIAREGGPHPYYSVRNLEILPDRMRIFISANFISPSGMKFKGIICNPNPFAIGIFIGSEIVRFNPNLVDLWNSSESELRSAYKLGNESIFPLSYSTNFKDSRGKQIEGVYSYEHPDVGYIK